jgi:hypothetical protein
VSEDSIASGEGIEAYTALMDIYKRLEDMETEDIQVMVTELKGVARKKD